MEKGQISTATMDPGKNVENFAGHRKSENLWRGWLNFTNISDLGSSDKREAQLHAINVSKIN